MSNVIQLRGAKCRTDKQGLRNTGPSASGVEQPGDLPSWRRELNEELRRSLLMLDLAAQRARVMAAQLAHPKVRGILLGHVDTVEALLRRARSLAWGP